MQKANRITDRFIYGILAALLFYMIIFVYLNVNTVKRSYVFESYFDNPALDISKEELKEYEPYCAGVGAIHVPQTGIVDYLKVAIAYGEKIKELGGEIYTGHKVLKIEQKDSLNYIETSKSSFKAKLVINCAGLYSDKVARLSDESIDDVKIIPFRGEYYKIKPEREFLVKNLIYPVPDPNFPFLGVHFTRMKKGGVEAGPNAVLAFKREGYKKSQINIIISHIQK